MQTSVGPRDETYVSIYHSKNSKRVDCFATFTLTTYKSTVSVWLLLFTRTFRTATAISNTVTPFWYQTITGYSYPSDVGQWHETRLKKVPSVASFRPERFCGSKVDDETQTSPRLSKHSRMFDTFWGVKRTWYRPMRLSFRVIEGVPASSSSFAFSIYVDLPTVSSVRYVYTRS